MAYLNHKTHCKEEGNQLAFDHTHGQDSLKKTFVCSFMLQCFALTCSGHSLPKSCFINLEGGTKLAQLGINGVFATRSSLWSEVFMRSIYTLTFEGCYAMLQEQQAAANDTSRQLAESQQALAKAEARLTAQAQELEQALQRLADLEAQAVRASSLEVPTYMMMPIVHFAHCRWLCVFRPLVLH